MKKNYLQESPRLCLSVIWLCIGVGLFLFLDSVFAYHFRFIEQFRLFRFSAEYAQEHFSYPGGPAFYAASFLIQYYIHPHAGALISALLALLACMGLRGICRHLAPRRSFPLLWLVVGMLPLVAELDSNHHLEETLAFLLSIYSFYLYLCLPRSVVRVVYLLAVSWLGFYLAGPMYEMTVLSALVYECVARSSLRKYYLLLPVSLLPAILYYWAGKGGESRVLFTPDAYYSSRLQAQAVSYYVWAALPTVVLITTLSGYLKKNMSHRLQTVSVPLQTALAFGVLYVGFRTGITYAQYITEQVNTYSRDGAWGKIVATPLNTGRYPLHAGYKNLALAEKKLLGDYLFDSKQPGSKGLCMDWNRTIDTSSLLSDVYWAMGNVAQAQRMAFEGMVASEWAVNPRLLLRLVKTNLILGHHRVAAKYLRPLLQSYGYRAEAERLKRLVGNDEAVRADAELGPRYRCVAALDGLCSVHPVRNLLDIVESNPDYPTSFQYLLGYALLSKDLNTLAYLGEAYGGGPGLTPVPLLLQQAIVLIQETNPQVCSSQNLVSQAVAGQFKAFKHQMEWLKENKASSATLRAEFGNTFWYYYLFVSLS